MNRTPVRGSIRATTLVVLLVALPAVAEELTGTVVDSKGQPVVGAEVCYMLGSAKGICVETDKKGVYDLPLSQVSTIQVEASGFQARVLKLDKGHGPIVLDRAAALWVRVRDAATGRTLPDSEVFLIFPAGRREGPLPANDKGVKIRTLMPGRYGVLARAAGYAQVKAVSVELVAGSDEWVDIEMKLERKKR